MKWGDKRYNNLNYFLREKFGEKVFKISLDAGFSCPNRDGTISSGGCVFCSERGSGDFAGNRCFSITTQFDDIKEMMNKKWKGSKYIAYFQAYTNTYGDIDTLKSKYEEAVQQDGVVALAIATRPDCLGEEILDLIEEFNTRVYTWVELGLQTMHENTARLINRGYPLPVFEEALEKLNKRGIDVVVHAIFGLPGETEEQMLETVKYLAHKQIKGVKFHLLHLMKNTPLEIYYNNGMMNFLSQDQYIDLICRSIALLPPEVVVHRLTGDAPRELLIGPMWSLKKWEVLNAIDRELDKRGWYQGLYFYTNSI